MSSTVVYNNFVSPTFWRNRFRRTVFEIWDANLHHGDVRPFACPTEVCASGTLRKLYYQPECPCHGFSDDRDIVQGFCDLQHFHILNGRLHQATTTELCAGHSGCLAGAPFLNGRPNAGGSCGSCDGTAVSYVVTFVTEHAGIQVEGAPSKPSFPVTSGGDVPGVGVSWGAAPPGHCVVATRLYRVVSSFEDGTTEVPFVGSEFVFVREFQGGGGGLFADNVPTADTGGPLVTYDPMAFPAPDHLIGVARTTDGIAVADSNRVYVSVAGQPQFTFDGVVEVEDTIRAIRAIGNQIFVFTDNRPVKVGYQLKDGAMALDRQVLNRHLPLLSKRSLSIFSNSIYFSSTHSLYRWDTGVYGKDLNAALTSLVTPEQWLNIDPDSIVGTAYELGYIFSSDEIDFSLMVEFERSGTDTVNGTSMMPISYIASPNAFSTDHDGHIIYQENNAVYRWDWRRRVCSTFQPHDHVRPVACEQCECCPWQLKLYYDNEGKNHFSHMRVEWDERSADGLDVSFHAFEFGREVDISETMKIISSRGFGIPTNRGYQTPYANLIGCAIMHEVRFATSAQELVSTSNRLLQTEEGG